MAQGPYLADEEIPVELTITNNGDAPATEVKATGLSQFGAFLTWEYQTWRDLDVHGHGATFAPGESRTYHLVGNVPSLVGGSPVVRINATGLAEANPADNFQDVTVNLVPAGTTDRVAGQVFADANGDGLPTPGEELAGVKAIAYVWDPGANHVVTTTDANGRFSLDGIPVGAAQRHIGFEDVPAGWELGIQPAMRLDGTGQYTSLTIMAKRVSG
ncbi:hypothetical protein AVR91_0231775 [Amycolatopsis keratiniphila subsp. keratiniphila]|uniref:SD-repeat containing protein B domain-containing protein n=1 Tax=Amycolatopsis keratiniphila subsp. keratiniphila TaxID=227715 RepID=A0A1W2LLN9_9PSEU|nr:hypothetical protein AVR91_0231775 [Amycolatopsis keratiniphila subsp. keratiniphila]